MGGCGMGGCYGGCACHGGPGGCHGACRGGCVGGCRGGPLGGCHGGCRGGHYGMFGGRFGGFFGIRHGGYYGWYGYPHSGRTNMAKPKKPARRARGGIFWAEIVLWVALVLVFAVGFFFILKALF